MNLIISYYIKRVVMVILYILQTINFHLRGFRSVRSTVLNFLFCFVCKIMQILKLNSYFRNSIYVQIMLCVHIYIFFSTHRDVNQSRLHSKRLFFSASSFISSSEPHSSCSYPFIFSHILATSNWFKIK